MGNGFGGMARRRSQWYVQYPCENQRTYTVRKATMKADGKRDYNSLADEIISKHKSAADANAAVKSLETAQLKAEGEARKSKGRTREIFPSAEVPHLWMHKIQPSASNARRTLYFEGDVIYSYGSHFPMAVHVTNAKGKPAILINSASYSCTTSQHQGAVRSAIPDDAVTFEVPQLGISWRSAVMGESVHNDNVIYFQRKVTEYAEKAARARSESRDWSLRYALEKVGELKAYCKFFAVKMPRVKVPGVADLAVLRADLNKRQAENAKVEREANKRRAAEALEAAKVSIENFRAGKPYGYLNNIPAMLRVNTVSGELETSKGARIPLAHAVRGLKFVRAVVGKGEDWVKNGHTFHLGHYSLDRVEANGTVHAGCHVIGLDEIERIAPDVERWQASHAAEVREAEAADNSAGETV
jgi:hypothetical protein